MTSPPQPDRSAGPALDERPRSRRPWTLAAWLLVFVALPWVALRHAPTPYLWVFPLVGIFLVWRAVQNRDRAYGPVLLSLGVLFLALTGIEAYQWRRSSGVLVATDAQRKSFAGPHDYLGYAPYPGGRDHQRLVADGVPVYDVTYDIGEDGLRVAPPSERPATEGSILFFGCSYTFGAGLANEDTTAYRVGTDLAGRYRAYNFGFGGYGPHQMLSAIEHGRVDEILEEPPRYAIYLGIASHIRRVVGHMYWDARGPRYELQPDGSVRLAGRFDDPDARPEPTGMAGFWGDVRTELRKSYFLRRIVPDLVPSGNYVELCAAIVGESRTRLETTYPGLEFHALLWDSHRVDLGPLQRALEKRGIRVHLMSEILPDFKEGLYRWVLHKKDVHPNSEAAAGIADWIVDNIVEE